MLVENSLEQPRSAVDIMHRTTDTLMARGRSRAKPRRVSSRPPFECIALLLQGGGALGSFQAGVYEALAEAGLHPDWVAGISIGAINSAIIAGNPPAERVAKLRSFWEALSRQISMGHFQCRIPPSPGTL